MSLTTESSTLTDEQLVQSVRRGVTLAYVELYERHVAASRRLARSVVHNVADAEDAVSEAFASVLAAIQNGKGPHDAFSGYLMSCVRHECYRANRRARATGAADARLTDGLGDDPSGEIDPFARRDDAELLRRALQSLPPTWRDVLWRTEVEGMSHQAIAGMTNTTAPAVAAQAMRARRALAAAYLHGHVDLIDGGKPECIRARRHLADLVRGRIGSRRKRGVEGHLDACPSCRHARDELLRLNQRLRAVWPLALTRGGLAELFETGVKARLLEWVPSSVPSAVAATGLIVGVVVGPATPMTESQVSPRVSTLEVVVDETLPPSTEVGLAVVPIRIERAEVPVVPVVPVVPAVTTAAPPPPVETLSETTVETLPVVPDATDGAAEPSAPPSAEVVAAPLPESLPPAPVTSPESGAVAAADPQAAAPPEPPGDAASGRPVPKPDAESNGPPEPPTQPDHPDRPEHPAHPAHPAHPVRAERLTIPTDAGS